MRVPITIALCQRKKNLEHYAKSPPSQPIPVIAAHEGRVLRHVVKSDSYESEQLATGWLESLGNRLVVLAHLSHNHVGIRRHWWNGNHLQNAVLHNKCLWCLRLLGRW